MEHKNVIVEKEGGIGFLVLNRPPLNIFNMDFFSEVTQTYEELEDDPEVRLIVVKSALKIFCGAADVSEIVTLDHIGCQKFFRGAARMFLTPLKLTKPTIAMVHGHALAVGMLITESCDLAVASEDAMFGHTAVNVGLFCTFGSAVLSPRHMSKKKAMELALTGELIDVKEAERLGIVNMVVPREKLEAATMELAQKILKKNPGSLITAKRNFYACADMEYGKALEHSAEMLGFLADTEGAREGMRAFLEKRKPRWQQVDR
jgi:enoyl-CoA hydratase/carnithine racemase